MPSREQSHLSCRDYTVFKKKQMSDAEIHYGLNGFKREIASLYFSPGFLSIQSILDIPCPSFFSFFFSFLLSFFFLLQLAPRECIHKVAVHSASGLNYGSYFLWVAGWYPTFVYRSLRYGNAVVYIQKFMYSSPSNASSACRHHHHHHHRHYRATRKISSMESLRLLLFRFITSWRLRFLGNAERNWIF